MFFFSLLQSNLFFMTSTLYTVWRFPGIISTCFPNKGTICLLTVSCFLFSTLTQTWDAYLSSSEEDYSLMYEINIFASALQKLIKNRRLWIEIAAIKQKTGRSSSLSKSFSPNWYHNQEVVKNNGSTSNLQIIDLAFNS